VTPVSYLRTATSRGGRRADGYERLKAAFGNGPDGPARGRGPGRYVALALLLLAAAVLVVGAVVFSTSKPSIAADPSALARIDLATGGGTIESVRVHGRHDRLISATVRDGRIWPNELIAAHELVTVEVVVKRPGWISWLAGSSDKLRMASYAPSAALREHYLTLRPGAQIKLAFTKPVQAISFGPPGHLHRRVLTEPSSSFTIERTAEAGTIMVAAAPRVWETSRPAIVSWFPSGSAASAVANPAPGTQIQPHTPITLTFSKPVSQALGSSRPPVTPATTGTWHTINSHTIEFRPEGYGYGLSTSVGIGLPSGVRLVAGNQTGTASSGSWPVPAGSMLRMQQILAQLGYLPLDFTPGGSPVANDLASQEQAAVHAPAGSFHWRYPNVPDSLKGFWSPGSDSVLTRGALMAFQNDHGLSTDGTAGPAVWKSLLNASISDKRSTFGYTYVMVSVPAQKLTLWHNGKSVLTTAVNTGIASQPTATGTYPVFEHIASGTMSGTNPDGSHYDDPGIQFISYFNGGDALHAFNRAQYGSPQSLGCVEMATGPAGAVYPYTPIGTLVHVA
jgi:lipoprotein-anchoring transpeptidase ErfK/SrfK